jgi:pyrroline-5-carboxylate reductase
MGSALARGWVASPRLRLSLSIEDPAPATDCRTFLVQNGAVFGPLSQPPDVLVLAIKPQAYPGSLSLIRPMARPRTLVVSIMAGITSAQLTAELGTGRVVRAMPNTPAAIGRGITSWVCAAGCDDGDLRHAQSLLEATGPAVRLNDEAELDIATAIAGCGPAYVFLLTEVLAAVGEARGLAPAIAASLARATVTGSAALMEARPADAPSALRHEVTSPQGVTAAALDILMASEDGLKVLMDRAIAAALVRSAELGAR